MSSQVDRAIAEQRQNTLGSHTDISRLSTAEMKSMAVSNALSDPASSSMEDLLKKAKQQEQDLFAKRRQQVREDQRCIKDQACYVRFDRLIARLQV